MATIKSVSLKRKKELEEPDPIMIFLRGCMQYYVENKKYFLPAIIGVLALTIISIGFRVYSASSEKKAFIELDKHLNKYQTLAVEKGEYLAFLDIEKDFQTFLEKYSSRAAGRMAAIFYANICYSNGNYDNAVSIYEKALKNFKTKEMGPYKNLILSSLGYSYEGKQDYNRAAEYFEMIVSGPVDFMKDDALFNLGRIYAAAGEAEKSRKAFETILSDYSESIYIGLIKEKLTI